MARITFCMAIAHSGMLGRTGDHWLEDGERDRSNKNPLWFRNKVYLYKDLEEHRRGENLERFLTLEERRARSSRCMQALDAMRQAYKDNAPDIVVILGKDQREIFIETTPALAIYTGKTIENGPPQRPNHAPDYPVSYPGHPELADHLIRTLIRDGFDMAEVSKTPVNAWAGNERIIPHAWGFVYHRLMNDAPPPSVPVFMNTFYEPNQPTIRRSIDFGRALIRAIKAWDSDRTVGIIGSGGLTHFVCDEETDRMFLNHFENYDFDGLAKVDELTYQSGTSEVKCFVPLLIAAQETGLEMNLVDYVPCYRTPAGTGEGMPFIYWAARQAGKTTSSKDKSARPMATAK